MLDYKIKSEKLTLRAARWSPSSERLRYRTMFDLELNFKLPPYYLEYVSPSGGTFTLLLLLDFKIKKTSKGKGKR